MQEIVSVTVKALVIHGSFFNMFSSFFILSECSLLASALDVLTMLLAIGTGVTLGFLCELAPTFFQSSRPFC